MSKIYACELVPTGFPLIEPIEAPIPFENIWHYEKWLREHYIPKTSTIKLAPLPGTAYDIDINKTECWAIFLTEERFERACQVYPETQLTPVFENIMRGKILSHNHFSDDSTFSRGDVLVWANLHLNEIRAVTKSKTYSIKPIKSKWPNPEKLLEILCKWPSIDVAAKRHQCLQFLSDKKWFEYSIFEVTE